MVTRPDWMDVWLNEHSGHGRGIGLRRYLKELEAERDGMVLVPEDIALHVADYWSQDFSLGSAWDYMPDHPVILWAKKYTAQQFEPTAETAQDSPAASRD